MIQSTAPERVSIEVSPQGGELDIDAPTPLELAALVLVLSAAIVCFVMWLRARKISSRVKDVEAARTYGMERMP